MTFGVRTTNDSGVVNIDENTKAYVYLGKYGPVGTSGVQEFSVAVTCVGRPIIFFTVPNDFTAGDSTYNRSGIAMTALTQVDASTWNVTFFQNNMSTTVSGGFVPFNTYVRVFGRLDLNFPSGSSETHGFRVWDSAGALVFDSGLRMLRLASNTYDTEVALSGGSPGDTTGDPSADFSDYDVSITLPSAVSSLSVCAGNGGPSTDLFEVGSYTDVEGQVWVQYDAITFGYAYWSSGTSLVARRVPFAIRGLEFAGGISGGNLNAFSAYTRLATISNAQFP